jgi:hypothetical protein
MTAPVDEKNKNDQKTELMNQVNKITKTRDTSVNYNTIQQKNYGNPTERLASYQRKAHTRGTSNNAGGNDSKSPDKYVINQNLVVNLNDSIAKPVKRENSNTTHITGVTASTAITGGSNPV